jgi:hypothetical protein
MRKIAIFTEGQSELIFVRRLIYILYQVGKVNFQCIKLVGDRNYIVPYPTNFPDAEIFILIINVQNDSRVLSAIRDREEGLFNSGFEAVLGLRDMYCELYKDLARNINSVITNKIIQSQISVIQGMHNPENIFMYFEIMEFESWLLSMYDLFRKLDEKLTVEYIEETLGYNLREIGPEITFFHPTNNFSQILKLIGFDYDKSEDQIESILSLMNESDILQAVENGRCNSLQSFIDKMGEFNS